MKLSEYAKLNFVTYKTVYNHWKKGLIKGKQLPTIMRNGKINVPIKLFIYVVI